jgi:oxygen-independent coproporphyrinogen-3 oxidase
MVGLGCGARSYTKNVHYSYEYGISHGIVKGIIERFIDARNYKYADYGFVLNEEEQKRRFVLKSLLHKDGIDFSKYNQSFKSDLFEDFTELTYLVDLGYAKQESRTYDKVLLKLTLEGLALSDSIGPWLMSQNVKDRMERYVLL